MKRVVFWMTALVIAMFWAMTVQAQESQDSIESVNKAAIELRCAVLDCLQRNRVNESGDLGYNQFCQCNRFSTHKLLFSIVYRLNATRSKYKGTGAGKEAQARMST